MCSDPYYILKVWNIDNHLRSDTSVLDLQISPVPLAT